MSLDLSNFQGPIGPVRGAKVVTVGNDDIVDGNGFIVQGNGAAGNLVCTPITPGSDDFTLAVAASQYPVFELGGVPVICRTVKGTSTVASFIKVTL